VNFGGRFSPNARGPSFASSDPKTRAPSAFSRTKPDSRPSARTAISLAVRTASGPFLQIVSAPDDEKEKDKVSFSINAVAASAVDTAKVLQLVDQLSATDQEKRDEAFKLLTTYGPGIAPLLEKVIEMNIVDTATFVSRRDAPKHRIGGLIFGFVVV